MSDTSPTALLLNAGHAIDHLFLLIFATAVGAIAAEWGMVLAGPDALHGGRLRDVRPRLAAGRAGSATCGAGAR